jgi:ComF family protein
MCVQTATPAESMSGNSLPAGPMMTARMRTSAVLSSLVRLLAPERCAGCDLPAPPAAVFCPACAPLLEPPPVSQRPPGLAASAYLYVGPLADGIKRLKYGHRTELGAGLGALLAEAALPYAGMVDCVIALPLHPTRLRDRGFNQSVLLARPVARALGADLDLTSLRRVRPTRDQASLQRAQRVDNLRGAFAVVGRSQRGRALLIDDVRTTGATLAAAAACLLEAGFAEVRTLALARAD